MIRLYIWSKVRSMYPAPEVARCCVARPVGQYRPGSAMLRKLRTISAAGSQDLTPPFVIDRLKSKTPILLYLLVDRYKMDVENGEIFVPAGYNSTAA